MLALRLARGAHPVVHLRRALVTVASAGTGFLLLCALGHALAHPYAPAGSALRLAWCAVPLATTVYFAVAVARTDPGTRPRPGLAAIGLGPGRLMAVSAVTTALSTTLGSMLALLFFLHLRGDLTGLPFDGHAADVLAADRHLPVPATLTLLALVPATASVTTALSLRPRGRRPEDAGRTADGPKAVWRRGRGTREKDPAHPGGTDGRQAGQRDHGEDPDSSGAPARARRGSTGSHALSEALALCSSGTSAPWTGTVPDPEQDPYRSTAPQPAPGGLPWGVAVLAAGLAVEMYASRYGTAPGLALPGGSAGGPAGVLGGWVLTALGLILAGPGLTHLCGQVLQAVRPGALRLLAGRVLQEEARRIGRPLGVVCAVASGTYAMATVYSGARPHVGPLTTLGALLVTGCAVLTLATAALEARNARAETTAALLRLGAPATALRAVALLRAGALFAVFGPLTWTVAELAATPLTP
ncbi:hypothetical protein ACFS5L_21785 [Streptomyces phyllanthi]|uniref:Uncharacterized protein n=1 Tax=Streptomyces phyllanthi TaxID=1803180 RepID=A0A5N8W727_9ACTN|nr:hypothetical protein [Streptomyces phyllanthi]MPY43293.1 hypothetical protein [Streptomyces phyllanthi]